MYPSDFLGVACMNYVSGWCFFNQQIGVGYTVHIYIYIHMYVYIYIYLPHLFTVYIFKLVFLDIHVPR